MSSRNGQPDRLRISDFSDRELLALLLDMGQVTSARELAQRVWDLPDKHEELPHATRCVTSRLVWMRRYGLVKREDDGQWAISETGVKLRTTQTSQTVAVGIDRMAEDGVLDLANTVGLKLVNASEIHGRAMQRELVHQINRRRSRLRGW